MMEDKKRLAIQYGFVTYEFGRIRNLPLAKEYYTKYGYDILDSLKLYKKYKDDEIMYNFMKGVRSKFKNELNNAINFCIQSSAASVMNRSGVVIADKIKRRT
jgi:hypothetical protein